MTGMERNSTIHGSIKALIEGEVLETMPRIKPMMSEQIPPVMPRDKVTPMCIQKLSVVANLISVMNDFMGDGNMSVLPVKWADKCHAVRMLTTPIMVGVICLFFFTNRLIVRCNAR